jgi:hypothetical protein
MHSHSELSPRRAASFDESLFMDLEWAAPDPHASHEISDGVLTRDIVGGSVPQTPRLPVHLATETPKVPTVGTASSNTFGAKMSVPKISIARSSDDVFGAYRSSSNEFVIEDGRVLKRVRAVESKLSSEDLARYGGMTAPGDVEWM